MNKNMPSSVQFVKGVGPKRAKLLEKLNIETIRDLVYYFPRDYEDRRKITPINKIKPGETVTTKGTVSNIKLARIRKGLNILRVTFTDSSGAITGVWFNQPYLKKKFNQGQEYYISGELNVESLKKYNKKEINNPVYEKSSGQQIHTGRVVPIYSLTNGLPQRRMRMIIFNTLTDYAPHLENILPDCIQNKYNFPSLQDSLWGLHFPQNRQHYISSYKRLAFTEFFLMQLLVLENKKGSTGIKGIVQKGKQNIVDQFLSSLPFKLTGAQQNVWEELKKDMESPSPMQRLLQGDVGSGKTVVATLALIKTVTSNYQGIFMAPTEILAEQHYYRLKQMLKDLPITISLLKGSLAQGERQEILHKIEESDIDIIVGTHALFQDDINYSKVGLAVIDEQHRFGVEQRHHLKEKGDNPDLLVMTATPIPRSLALTLYGDLDVSIIDEMPPGRKEVTTLWYHPDKRNAMYDKIRNELNKGRQAYIVCPLIEPSSEVDAVSASEMKTYLKKTYLNNYNLGLLHGQLKTDEKKQVMERFRKEQIDVLVSTTVIEVGVDVPNATMMIIENAERFGLAQLHQLRGRVGRGKYQSYCFLVGKPTTESSQKRLEVMTQTNDGFKIAERDLEIRGPGEFFGTKQHGLPDFRVANLLKDQKILNQARMEAKKIIDNTNWTEDFPLLKKRIKNLDIKL